MHETVKRLKFAFDLASDIENISLATVTRRKFDPNDKRGRNKAK